MDKIQNELNQYRGKYFNGEWPTIYEMFATSCGRFPDRPCFTVFDPKRKSYTYAQVDEMVRKVATKLVADGVKKGELEQAYANWLAILDMVPHAEAVSAVERLFSRVSAMESKDTSSTVFEVITDMTQKYLYDPNSPFRNEDFYLPFVKGLSQSAFVSEEMKPGYEYDAQMCALNQVGTKAADFVFCDRNGRRYSLYGIDADHVILFFSNPGCHACKDIIDVLSGDPGISAAVKAGKLAVLNIYIDSDLTEWYRYMPVYPDDWYNGYDPNLVIRNDMLYNIRAIPSLYLLDEDKRVILKDAPQETVFAWLANNI